MSDLPRKAKEKDPCAKHKKRKEKCEQDCPLRKLFPAKKMQVFKLVTETFGVPNMERRITKNAATEEDMKKAADSIIWIAMAFEEEPVTGPQALYNQAEARCAEKDNLIKELKATLTVKEAESAEKDNLIKELKAQNEMLTNSVKEAESADKDNLPIQAIEAENEMLNPSIKERKRKPKHELLQFPKPNEFEDVSWVNYYSEEKNP